MNDLSISKKSSFRVDKVRRFAEVHIYNISIGLEILVFIHDSDKSLFERKSWLEVKRIEQIREIIDYILSKEVDIINEICYRNKLYEQVLMMTDIKRRTVEVIRERIDFKIGTECGVLYNTSDWDKLAETILMLTDIKIINNK